MEQDQFFGGPFALRILDPHTSLRSYPLTDKKQSESQGVSNGMVIVRGAEKEMQEWEGADRRSSVLAEAPR
jgi:hypothetical protein